MKDIKGQIRNGIAQGNVSLSSNDVAGAGAGETVDGKPVGEELTKNTTVPVAPEAKGDTMLKDAEAESPGKSLKGIIEREISTSAITAELTSKVEGDKVELTPEDKATFLDALISGERFKLKSLLFGNNIEVVISNRTQEESKAILAQLSAEVTAKRIVTTLDYSTRLRSMILAAQVRNLNGLEFPILAKPLLRVVTKPGDEDNDPAWVDQVAVWADKDEGLVTAIFEEIKLFEIKYWTMVSNAKNQNFWKPAAST